ncbi:DUF2240 family protein [Candidatus Woesearchaeota archaeon]|nr:DUF2240 family protein [Candidatus Woesearchaeota archaeon]
MIKIPLSQIVEKIKEKSGMSEDEINSKIKQKMEQLSGLVSEEGAAHIIANDLGIKLIEEAAAATRLQIKNILAGMRDVETVGKVQQTYPITEFQRKDGSPGKVANIVIADETGSIRVVMWGSQTDSLKDIKEGDVVKIISGYTRENNNRTEIHLGDRSKIEINPEGETLGEVKAYSSTRKKISELKEEDNDVELLGTVLQVFEPRFFEVCPECNKRVRQREGGFFCESHQTVEPAYSYVLNAIIDDGSESIRAVFFRRQAENLLEMDQQKILEYKDNPERFEEVKTSLLGNIIKVIGRTSKNELFDRLEFVANRVFPKPDPKEEIERLKKEAENKKEEGIEEEPEKKEDVAKPDSGEESVVVDSSSAEEISGETNKSDGSGDKLPGFEDI